MPLVVNMSDVTLPELPSIGIPQNQLGLLVLDGMTVTFDMTWRQVVHEVWHAVSLTVATWAMVGGAGLY